jgi:hypothetical protein
VVEPYWSDLVVLMVKVDSVDHSLVWTTRLSNTL